MKVRLVAIFVLTIATTCAQAASGPLSSTVGILHALKNYQGIVDGRIRYKDITYEETVNADMAFGYVLGVTDTLFYTKKICVPPGVAEGQFLAVSVKYMDDHPDWWQYNPSLLIADALEHAFPCKHS